MIVRSRARKLSAATSAISPVKIRTLRAGLCGRKLDGGRIAASGRSTRRKGWTTCPSRLLSPR